MITNGKPGPHGGLLGLVRFIDEQPMTAEYAEELLTGAAEILAALPRTDSSDEREVDALLARRTRELKTYRLTRRETTAEEEIRAEHTKAGK